MAIALALAIAAMDQYASEIKAVVDEGAIKVICDE